MDNMDEVIKRLLPEIDMVLAELAAKRSADRLAHYSWLESNWDRICQAAFGPLEAELAQLKANTTTTGLWHVLNSEVDLLGPLDQQYREVAHTQSLAYLFNPTESHGLKGEVLRLFLKHLLPIAALWPKLQYASTHIADMAEEADKAEVEAERMFENDDKVRGRTDLWIETPKDSPKNILLTEMKVGMAVSSQQLERYERALAARLGELDLAADAAIKVLLTYEVPHPGQYPGWFVVHWRKMAAALAPACVNPTSGGIFLKFYLATILKRIENIQIEPSTLKGKLRLRDVLRVAMEDLG
jgi:hypothetical protein